MSLVLGVNEMEASDYNVVFALMQCPTFNVRQGILGRQAQLILGVKWSWSSCLAPIQLYHHWQVMFYRRKRKRVLTGVALPLGCQVMPRVSSNDGQEMRNGGTGQCQGRSFGAPMPNTNWRAVLVKLLYGRVSAVARWSCLYLSCGEWGSGYYPTAAQHELIAIVLVGWPLKQLKRKRLKRKKRDTHQQKWGWKRSVAYI